MIKALLVYGTRYGATADTSEVIAAVLRQEGFDVRVVDAKREKGAHHKRIRFSHNWK